MIFLSSFPSPREGRGSLYSKGKRSSQDPRFPLPHRVRPPGPQHTAGQEGLFVSLE